MPEEKETENIPEHTSEETVSEQHKPIDRRRYMPQADIDMLVLDRYEREED